MTAMLAMAGSEWRIGWRNRWVLLAGVMMAVLAILLAMLGSTPTGEVDASRYAVSVVSLASLSVYLIPLLALLLAIDAIVGESDRGTLLLLLTYPIGRLPMLLGKFIGHLALLSVVIAAGYTLAFAAIASQGMPGPQDVQMSLRLLASAMLLGAVYLAIGYALSALARDRGAAAAMALAVWLLSVVLYDIALLAMLSAGIASEAFPYLLILNPGDAFRLLNLAGFETVELASGLAGALPALPVPPVGLWLILVSWLAVAWLLAWFGLRRREA